MQVLADVVPIRRTLYPLIPAYDASVSRTGHIFSYFGLSLDMALAYDTCGLFHNMQ